MLVRNRRSYVPVLEGTRLPSALQRHQDNAKYCSVFFRPWTLLAGTEDVPELQHLGAKLDALRIIYADKQGQVRRRMTRRQAPANTVKKEDVAVRLLFNAFPLTVGRRKWVGGGGWGDVSEY